MSSRSKSKSKGSSYYPTQWSAWEWNEELKCQARYRLRAPNDYEYDYWRPQELDVPRTPGPPEPTENAPEPEPPEPESSNYTISPVDNITRGMANLSSNTYPQQGYITTRNPRTQSEKFDPNYKVHKAWEFQWGKVFKVLWTEPAGNGGDGSEGTESVRGKGKHRQFEKVRRFVIVKQMDGHCICLPIMTYSRQGANKGGVHAEHHAIIYTDKEPSPLPGEREKGLTRVPIRVSPSQPRHKLDPTSRLNYAKLYTVEYNVKVWFIGRIHPRSEPQITADYNHVHPPMTRGLGSGSLPTVPSDTFGHAQGGGATPYHIAYDQYTPTTYGPTGTSPYSTGTASQPYYSGDAGESIEEEAEAEPPAKPEAEAAGEQLQAEEQDEPQDDTQDDLYSAE